MARTKRKILRLMPIILLVALATFIYMTLYNGETVVDKRLTSNVMQKLSSEILGNGGQFEITQEDMNAAIKLYFKEPIRKGDIIVKEVNTKISDDEILIEAPFSYKNQNLLFSSKGKLSVSDGEITYDVDNFKIGKLLLPKKLVMTQISKKSNDQFYVKDNLLKIKTGVFPLAISSLEIEGNKIVGKVGFKGLNISIDNINNLSEKQIDNRLDELKQKIQNATSNMSVAQKIKANAILNRIDNVKGQSIERRKQALEYANDIVNKVTK